MRPTLDPDLIPLPAIAYTCRSPSIEKFQAAALIGVFDLDEDERWWRDQYHILLEHGYKLRRRFRPDWTPSWLGTSKIPAFCEDSLLQIVSPLYKRLEDVKSKKPSREHCCCRRNQSPRRNACQYKTSQKK
jgi:hypothetical protein